MASNLRLTVDGQPNALEVMNEPAVSFPLGAGGLHTLRLECRLEAPLTAAATKLAVADGNEDGHVGWHEVVIAAGSGIRIAASDAAAPASPHS